MCMFKGKIVDAPVSQVGDCPEAHCLANIPLHEASWCCRPSGTSSSLPDTPEVGKADRRVEGNLGCLLENESPHVAESIDATWPRAGQLLAACVQAHQRLQELETAEQQTVSLMEPAHRIRFVIESKFSQKLDDLG